MRALDAAIQFVDQCALRQPLLASQLQDTGTKETTGFGISGSAYAAQIVFGALAHAATMIPSEANGYGIDVGECAAQIIVWCKRTDRRVKRSQIRSIGLG